MAGPVAEPRTAAACSPGDDRSILPLCVDKVHESRRPTVSPVWLIPLRTTKRGWVVVGAGTIVCCSRILPATSVHEFVAIGCRFGAQLLSPLAISCVSTGGSHHLHIIRKCTPAHTNVPVQIPLDDCAANFPLLIQCANMHSLSPLAKQLELRSQVLPFPDHPLCLVGDEANAFTKRSGQSRRRQLGNSPLYRAPAGTTCNFVTSSSSLRSLKNAPGMAGLGPVCAEGARYGPALFGV